MSESDDSDAEGGLGNVTRVVLRPPGHSGKAKRGHLCFDASYESGNLGRVDFISEYEYDLFIRPDTCNPRYRLWFNFVVDNVRADQRVIFNVVNLCKIKTLYRDGMTPLVKTTSRPRWQRLPGKYVYYHKSPEHRNHYILSFAFAFDREEDVYQFAFSFPYSYARCQAHLELIEQREFPYFRRETIGYSLQNRKLDVITIANFSELTGKKAKVVVILARSHPGESPTSYIAQGIMDFMISNHPIATAVRDHVIIKIVPMINPDGVYLGNFRCSLMGYDLNRQWNQISPWAHPTLSALKNYLFELDSSKTMELDMVIDLHAHTSLMGAFIHGNAYDDVYRFERHILFPKLLAHNAEDYSPTHTMYNRDPVKAGTARRHLCEILRNTVNVYTLEVSFYGYSQPTTNSAVSYNEDGYFRLGRNIVRTFFEYFRVTGVIPVSATAAAPSGPTQNQEPEKKRSLRRKSRSRSRSRPKSKGSGSGAKASSPTQKTAISHDGNSETWSTPQSSAISKECTPERTVLKLNQLTTEKEEIDSTDDISSSDEDNPQKSVKFNGQREGAKRHQFPRRSTRGRLNMRLTSRQAPVTDPQDSSPSPPTSPKGSRSRVPLSQSSGHKTAFRTFDFSVLRENYYSVPDSADTQQRRVGDSSRRQRERSRASRSTVGRKVGGGGILGVSTRSSTEYHNFSRQANHSDTDTDAPCLTIIDFNLLLRKGLDGKASLNERGWKGWSSGKVMMGNQKSSTEASSQFNTKKHRRSEVRRRRAILLRGNITDCSPWEDTSSDSDSSIFPISRRIDSSFITNRRQSQAKNKKAGFPSSFSS